MGSFTNTVTIDRPIGAVFAFLADLENVPRWNYAIAETRRVSEGPLGVGDRYLQRRTLPSPGEEELVVTGFEPDRRLAVEGTLGSFPAHVDYVLEDRGGATHVTNTIELEIRGPLKLVGGVAIGRVRSAVAENLKALKRLLETG